MKNHCLAAKLCHLSYGKVEHKSFKWSADLSNKELDVEAFSFDHQGYRYITIRGTKGIKDWWRNFKTRLLITPYLEKGYTGSVKLHTGFYLGYLAIQPRVLELAKTAKKLIITGHSQGGAIAAIAGVDISFQLQKKVEVVTFGAPPIGNGAWQKSANNRILATCYSNKFDLVPLLLPKNNHIGKQINLNKLNFNPHHTKNYYKNIQTYAKKQS